MENSKDIPDKLKIELPYKLPIPDLGIYPKQSEIKIFKKCLCSHTDLSIAHNSQSVEAITDGYQWMSKENVMYTHNGMFFNLKKDILS